MTTSRLRVSKAEKTKQGTVRKTVNNAYHRSAKQEKEIAKAVGGRLTPRSGAGKEKGDVRLKGIARIEAKTTSRKSFSVTLEMLNKLMDAAVPTGEIPIHCIEFLDEDGKPIQSVAIMPVWAMQELLENAQ